MPGRSRTAETTGAARAPGGSAPVLGIVGAGQLARMLAEATSPLGVDTVVLAEAADDAACAPAGAVLVGSPTSRDDLFALAARCDAVTFDHEQVGLAEVGALEAAGHVVRPGTATLELAVDKARCRTQMAAAGIPVPAFVVLAPPTPGPRGAALALDGIETFAQDHGWPVVLKAARGGYDGKGVWIVADPFEARSAVHRAGETGVSLVVEELVPIDAELAVLVCRRAGGDAVVWPTVETSQVGGVCRELLVPSAIDPDVLDTATDVARRVAAVAGAVGVLAVELFVAAGTVLVNEVAARPHNSGHWSIEGARTSQFENHARAALDLPLGATDLVAPAVATVNVFGAPDGRDPRSQLARALEVAGAHVHLYGKAPRPGRKLGHVTVTGDEPHDVRARAWRAALALGTPGPDGGVGSTTPAAFAEGSAT
jgi:5-(carboxyamino)imidazole ribonucleotide synthase